MILNGLAPDQIAVYDVMGNRVPSSGPAIRFGRQPVYIEEQGITVEALQTAFERGLRGIGRTSSSQSDDQQWAARFRTRGRGELCVGRDGRHVHGRSL